MYILTVIVEHKLGNVLLWDVTALYFLKYSRGAVASWNSEGVSLVLTVPHALVCIAPIVTCCVLRF
jgi:hypothetical protein